MPLPVKCRKLLFWCTRRSSFTDFEYEESLACTMLFDSALKVPEKESSIHIKDRERAWLDNPFNACKRKQRETKRKSKTDEFWAQSFEVCDGIKRGVLHPWFS